jgi:four helix bundle protein
MPGAIRSFRDLVAWQKAMDLCEHVYTLSKSFPAEERFGLTAQIRRAAVSVPSNIAEGYGRARTQDYLRFLNVALGSLAEVETQLLLSGRLGFRTDDDLASIMALVRELDRVLCALIRAVSKSAHNET